MLVLSVSQTLIYLQSSEEFLLFADVHCCQVNHSTGVVPLSYVYWAESTSRHTPTCLSPLLHWEYNIINFEISQSEFLSFPHINDNVLSHSPKQSPLIHTRCCLSLVLSVYLYVKAKFVCLLVWIILTSLFSTCRLYRDRQKPANGTQCPTLTTDS